MIRSVLLWLKEHLFKLFQIAVYVSVIVFMFWVTDHVRQQDNLIFALQSASLKQPIAQKGDTGSQGPAGLSIIGPSGSDGKNGTDGVNGTNGQSVSQDELVQVVGQFLANNPDLFKGIQGDTGDVGAPGKTPEFRFNSDGKLEFRYVGDLFWQLVEGQ